MTRSGGFTLSILVVLLGAFFSEEMVGNSRVFDGGRRMVRPLALAASALVRIPCRDGGRWTLALARSHPVSARVRGRPWMRLGFRPDGTRKPSTVRPAEALGRNRFLQIRAQPNLRRRCGGLDWAMDRVRTRESGQYSDSRGGNPWHPFVRHLIRGAHTAQEVRRGLRRVSPECTPMVAASAGVEQSAVIPSV
jgi:hypothetical protein